MPGAITSSGDDIYRGWARIDEDPNYPATVHLISGDVIATSAIAERQGADPSGEDGTCSCWFELETKDFVHSSEAYVLIGETGECLFPPGECRAGANGRDVSPAFTDRDALTLGLAPEDVIEGFYLDILGRPADPPGLAHFMNEGSGAGRFDLCRRRLLRSSEYAERSKRATDAAGRIFGRKLMICASGRTQTFESLLGSFLASRLSLPERLHRYFPALRLTDGVLDRLLADSAAGLPDREVFFQALSRLAGRPSLILDPNVLSGPDIGADAGDSIRVEEHVYVVPCRSRLFRSGWHAVEPGAGAERRWMAQMGVILDPTGRRPVDHLQLSVDAVYSHVGQVIASTESGPLRASFDRRGETDCLLTITGENGPFAVRHVVLIAEQATCPFRLDGTPDPRLISFGVTQARFVCRGDTP